MIDVNMFGKIVESVLGRPNQAGRAMTRQEHLEASLTWIKNAIQATHGKGISKGYDLIRNRWAPFYCETTGYSIPTMINAGRYLSRPDLDQLAIQLAELLLECRTPEGGVSHWRSNPGVDPVIFDTGQVIFGWMAAYRISLQDSFLDAAVQAAEWMASVQEKDGAWKKFQHLGVVKVIDTRVDWAMLELDRIVDNPKIRRAAAHNLQWAARQQNADGWFQHCAFQDDADPITHTLAYTVEGLIESSRILNDHLLYQSGVKTADRMLALQDREGKLAATFKPGWKASSSSTCLTGDCQFSRVWLLLYQLTGQREYYLGATKALDFVMATQDMASSNPGIYGGISGSFPIYGNYERMKYPNWAAKFFVDAILYCENIDSLYIDNFQPG